MTASALLQLAARARAGGGAWLAWLLTGLLLAVGTGGVTAQQPQPVPPLDARLIDRSGTLGEPQRAALESRLAAVEAETGSQIVILLVETTAPEDIAAYAHRVADEWKIGRREVGDGVLVVAAMSDRRVRIEVAKTLEGAIPDLAASRIIEQAIVPAFRQGDHVGGLNLAIDRLAARIRGEPLPPVDQPRGTRGSGGGGFDLGTLGILFLVGVPVLGGVLVALLGRRLGSLVTAGGAGAAAWLIGAGGVLAIAAAVIALVLVGVIGVGTGGGRGAMRRRRGGVGMPVIWGGGLGGFGGGGRGGGWGGGGGGFSSGGGGNFGGGGASGSW